MALGFALAAIAVMLVEHFGHVAGYWMMVVCGVHGPEERADYHQQ
jgi:hypothetical protein